MLVLNDLKLTNRPNVVNPKSRAGSASSRTYIASSYKVIKIWSVAAGECVRILEGHTSYVGSILRSSYNSSLGECIDLLFTGAHDFSIKVWDIDDAVCIGTIDTESKVFSLCELANGWIVSAQWSGKIIIWDIKVKEKDGHNRQARPNLRLESRMVRMIRAHNYIVYRVVALKKGSITSPPSPSPSSVYFASSSADKTVAIWDAITGACIQKLLGHQGDVIWMIQLRNGMLATGSQDSTLIVWNLHDSENSLVEKLSVAPKRLKPTDPAELKDGSLLFGFESGSIERWELRSK